MFLIMRSCSCSCLVECAREILVKGVKMGRSAAPLLRGAWPLAHGASSDQENAGQIWYIYRDP